MGEEVLPGLKTYIFGGLVILSAILFVLKIIDYQTFLTLISIFGGAEGMALRKAIKKIENNHK